MHDELAERESSIEDEQMTIHDVLDDEAVA